MLDAPKNLTRNVLVAMFLGALIGAIRYYSSFFSDSLKDLIFEYIFQLVGAICINLLNLMVVPEDTFSLVSGLAYLASLKRF